MGKRTLVILILLVVVAILFSGCIIPDGNDVNAGDGNRSGKKCGDGVCDAKEKTSPKLCPADCGQTNGDGNKGKCGDGVCGPVEKEKGVCPEDCGQNGNNGGNGEECGNNVCAARESAQSCPEDCEEADQNWPASDTIIFSELGKSAPSNDKYTSVNTSQYSEKASSASADGLALYFHSNKDGRQSLYTASRGSLESKWGSSSPVIFEDESGNSINTLNSSEAGPSVYSINNEEMLFFSSDGALDADGKKYGSYDIYFSIKNSDSSWGRPKNLGANINTADDELGASVFYDAEKNKGIIFYAVGWKSNSAHKSLYPEYSAYLAAGNENLWFNTFVIENGEFVFDNAKFFKYNTSGIEDNPDISDDGKVLTYSAGAVAKKGTTGQTYNNLEYYGDFDLFYTFLENDEWIGPQNFGGSSLNSEGHEANSNLLIINNAAYLYFTYSPLPVPYQFDLYDYELGQYNAPYSGGDIFDNPPEMMQTQNLYGLQRLTDFPSSLSFTNAHNLVISGDKIYLIFAAAGDGRSGIYLKKSADLGLNWQEELKVSSEGGTLLNPSLAISGNGTLHAVWEDTSSLVYYARSDDDGISWSAPITLYSSSQSASSHPDVASDGDYVYVVWMNSNSNYIVLRTSADDGMTWSEEVHTSDCGKPAERPNLLIDNGGVVHQVWYDWCENTQSVRTSGIYHAVSRDKGATWQTVSKLVEMGTLAGHPYLTQDTAERLHLVYIKGSSSDVSSTGVPNVLHTYYRNSADGINWSEAVELDGDLSSARAMHPQVAYSSKYGLMAIWGDQDTRSYYFKTSADGGETWSSSSAITANNNNYASAKVAVDKNGVFHVVWEDDRNGGREIYYAYYK